MFRFAFGSNSSYTNDGFAFDDFEIYEVTPGFEMPVGNNLNLKVYPNPNDGNFTIDFIAGKETRIEVFLYNTVGQVALNKIFTSAEDRFLETMDVKHLPKGVYYLKIVTDGGTVVEKIVIE